MASFYFGRYLPSTPIQRLRANLSIYPPIPILPDIDLAANARSVCFNLMSTEPGIFFYDLFDLIFLRPINNLSVM